MQKKIILIVFDSFEDFHDLYKKELLKGYDSKQNNNEIEIIITDDTIEGFFRIASDNIPIVILEILSPQDYSFSKGLQIYKLLNDFFPDISIFIYSQVDFKEIQKESKKYKINIKKNNYFHKDPTKESFKNLKEKIFTELDYLFGSNIRLNDQWIIRRLDEKKTFESLGIKALEPLGVKIEDAFINHNNQEYSIWFSEEVYLNIFKKRIYPIFNIAGFEDIAKIFQDFLWFERLSYITPSYSPLKRYRDHFLHQLRIAVFGDFILNAYIQTEKSYVRLIDIVISLLENRQAPRKFQCKFNERVIRNTWWITALMHDCSYPLHSIYSPLLFKSASLNKLSNMYSQDLFIEIKKGNDNAIKKIVNSLELQLPTMIEETELHHFKDTILDAARTKKMHSIYSAFNLWQKYTGTREKNYCNELAVQAIVLHHELCSDENDERSVTFEDYPLAFLLILLDEIQEWGRPLILKEKSMNPTSISKVIELDEITVEGIYEKPFGSNNFYLDHKGLFFDFNYKKKWDSLTLEGINFNPAEKYTSKKRNLSRLRIHKQKNVLPPIFLDFKFPNFSPESIEIK